MRPAGAEIEPFGQRSVRQRRSSCERRSSEPSERAIGRYVFIEDPDGYVVEIFECLTPPYA